MKNELEQIAAERARQITAEGWTPEHDDKHGNGELAEAARSYEWHSDTTVNTGRVCMHMVPPSWPWGREWWKPTESPHRGYVKAGALFQAEADRCRRLGNEAAAIAMDERVHTVAGKLAALPPAAPITREQWLERCAAQFRRVCDTMPADQAQSLAESQLENMKGDLTESPEGAADDEMSYWGAD